MNRRPQLPLEIRKQIDAAEARAGELYREGKIKDSVNASLESWKLIPDPIEKWDYYPQSMAVSFVDCYVMLQDLENTKKWLKVTYKMYDDEARESQYVLMMEGESLFKLGEKDQAYEVFERIFTLHGKEGFYGEQIDYLVFFQKERASRNDR